MTQKFIWCGSSWETGDELELQISKNQVCQHVYPSLVSAWFAVECVNVSENHSAIPQLIWQLKSIENQICSGDTVFFSLPPPHWNMSVDHTGALNRIGPNFHCDPRVHANSQHWYRYFDNEYQRAWQNDISIEFLSNWCQVRGVHCYFYSSVNHYYSIYLNATVSWLLPPSTCLAELLVPVIDNTFFEVVTSDRSWLTESQWQSQKPLIEKYIAPCYAHPNLAGHKKIAEEFIRLLSKNYKSKEQSRDRETASRESHKL